MGETGQKLQLALREWRVPLIIWVLLSALAAMTGPFDTYRLLPPVARFGFWALVVGVSIGLDMVFRRVMAGQSLMQRLTERVGFALALAGMVHGLNVVVFDGWSGWSDFAYLVGVVWVVSAMVEVAHKLLFARPAPDASHLAGHTASTPASLPDSTPDSANEPLKAQGGGPGPAATATPMAEPGSGLLRHLPAAARGALIRIEAQDHYLNVVTDAGSALVLMRFGDAVAELSEVAGARVHRSHWVARAGVRGLLRKEGRQFLLTHDGAEVPVSRANRAALQALGLD